MIELFEGVPGSGKSYYAVAERLLPAVRKGRRVYVYVDGIYLDRLALFTGIERDELDKQITVWTEPVEVLTNLAGVDPGAFVIIDEAQTLFRSMERVDKRLLRWLETHRHFGVDILMLCQSHRQMSQGVTRLVEATILFRKLAFLGLQRRYQGKIRGTPEDTEVIRQITGKYDPALYAYYSSYSAAAVREEKRVGSIWRSGRMILALLALGFALWFLAFGNYLSAGEVEHARPKIAQPVPDTKSAKLPPPVGAGVESVPAVADPVVPVQIKIVGHGGFDGDYRYVLENGEILSAEEIAGRYGVRVAEVPVSSRAGKGLRKLVGPGVTYGSSGD